jgi:hypothetical protein
MVLEKGTKFAAILYDGTNIDAAQTVVSYLSSVRTNDRPIPLSNTDYKIQVINIAIMEHQDTDNKHYKIVLEGVLI